MNSRVKIYYHETCPTSVELLNKLKNLGLLSSIELINVSEHPFFSLSDGIVSVPAIFIEGKLLDFGPINIGEVVDNIKFYLETGKIVLEHVKGFNVEDAVKRLRRIVYDNLFLACNVYIREDLTWLLDSPKIIQLLNLDNEGKENLLKHLKSEQQRYLKDMEEKLLKVLRYNLLLELRLLFGEQKTNDSVKKLSIEYVMHWLIARSSVARISLVNPSKVNLKEKAEKLLQFIKSD